MNGPATHQPRPGLVPCPVCKGDPARLCRHCMGFGRVRCTHPAPALADIGPCTTTAGPGRAYVARCARKRGRCGERDVVLGQDRAQLAVLDRANGLTVLAAHLAHAHPKVAAAGRLTSMPSRRAFLAAVRELRSSTPRPRAAVNGRH